MSVGGSVKAMLDDLSANMADHLRSLPGVTDVVFSPGGTGASVSELGMWDQANPGYPLPEDLKSFLLVSDGLKLTWSLRITTPSGAGGAGAGVAAPMPLGCMRLNSLRDLHRAVELTSEDTFGSGPRKGLKFECHAFHLDSTSSNGHVALVYLDPSSPPEVWFRDMSCSWFFIARSFTDYFRLMVMHLGLPSWQYAFTDIGLDPTTKQWFRLLCPERLAIDYLHGRASESALLRETAVTIDSPPARRKKAKQSLDITKIDAAASNATKSRRKKASSSARTPGRPSGRSTGRPSSRGGQSSAAGDDGAGNGDGAT